LQPDDVFLSYNILFAYKYYRIEKQERFCATRANTVSQQGGPTPDISLKKAYGA